MAISSYIFDAIEYLPVKAESYVRSLAKLKAYELDPKYRQIEDRRHSSGRNTVLLFAPDLGVEDWIYQAQKVEDLTPSLRYWAKLREFSRRPRRYQHSGRRALQRVRKGYDEWAVHDFRSWHAHYVVKALQEYQETMHSHPADRSFEQWKRDVGDVIAKFELLTKDGYDDQATVDDAMDSFAKVYLHLWD